MSSSEYSTLENLQNSSIVVADSFGTISPRIHKELTQTAIPVLLGSKASNVPWTDSANETHGTASPVLSAQVEPRSHWVEFEERNAFEATSSIYFKSEPISIELRRAVQLLDEGRTFISSALEYLRQGSVRDSDELVIDFKDYLPELFCLRTISESFGAVINAIHNALDNRKGVPLTESHLMALDEILKSLLREPGMSFERAVGHVMRFEDAGFAVESQTLGGLLDLVEAFEQESVLIDVQG